MTGSIKSNKTYRYISRPKAFSLNRSSGPIQSLSCYVRMLSVCSIAENPLPYWHTSWGFWVLGFFVFQWFNVQNWFWGFWSLQTSLLCIMGKLAVGGSWPWLLTLVTGDRWHATRDTWHVTPDTGHVTHDTGHVTPDIFSPLSFCFCLFWYWCYYPYTSKHLVSSLCGTFLYSEISCHAEPIKLTSYWRYFYSSPKLV